MSNEYLEKLFSLEGKVAVVSGASGVLGSTIAEGLARAGAKLVIMGRSAEKLAAVEKRLKVHSSEVLTVSCDVLSKPELEKAYTEVTAVYPKIDILINAAGGASPAASTDHEFYEYDKSGSYSQDIFSMDAEAFRHISDLNFIGSFLPIQIFGRNLVEHRGGNIINISSMGAEWPLTKSPAYSAGKAAITNYTKWLAVYFGKANIRVNAIAPGFFLTEQNRFLLTDEKTGELSPRGSKITGKTPQGRFGEPEELITTALYLLSHKSSFVNGIVVPVDGGFSAYGGV